MIIPQEVSHQKQVGFMNIRELEEESRVVELECQSNVGLIFIAENVRNGTVNGLNNNPISKQSMIS